MFWVGIILSNGLEARSTREKLFSIVEQASCLLQICAGNGLEARSTREKLFSIVEQASCLLQIWAGNGQDARSTREQLFSIVEKASCLLLTTILATITKINRLTISPMLNKIWRFLKQLIQRLFGTNPKIEPTPPQPAPTLTDAEYEAKLMELLERVNQGWGKGGVAGFLMAKRIENGDLAAWLRRFGDRLLEGAQGSTASADAVVSLQELAHRLELLGRVAGGELGEVAGNVGREILVGFPLVSDREAEEWKKRGDEQYYERDFEEAIASYDKALEIKPDSHKAWFNLGYALDDLGRHEDAIASYDKALEIKPDLHEAWNNRGVALCKLGRFEEAIASYDKALKFKPDSHEAWYNRGLALYNLGRIKEAIASWDKALEIKPDFHSASKNRTIALKKLGIV